MLHTDSLETNNYQLSYHLNTARAGTTSAYGLSNSNGSFASNLPSGYRAYSGSLVRADEFLVPARGGIYGAPKPDNPPDDQAVFGNPNTRYAWVSADSDEFLYRVDPRSDSLQDVPPTFHVDGDDALILFGKTPPQSTYFSFNLYNSLTDIYQSDSPLKIDGYTYTGTSIGLGVNQENIKTTNTPSSPFDGYFALIVTSSTTTRDRMASALIKSGVPRSSINSYLFPKEFANEGFSDKPEQLSFLARYTFQTAEEKETVTKYMDQFTSLNKALDFTKLDDTISSYGSNQDGVSDISVENLGKTLSIEGDAWKKIELPRNINPNTVMQFDFRSTSEGIIQGIGFDNDNTVSYDNFFQIYGTHSVGIGDYDNYDQLGS